MKVYYPFTIFKSRSKPGERYTVNLRPPNEISCTCGAWKFYRNKYGNGGNCLHTEAVKELFTFAWNGNYNLRIGYNSLGDKGSNTRIIRAYTVEYLSSLKIPILDAITSTFGVAELNIELNNVFSRLIRNVIKGKEDRRPKKLLDLTQEKIMKNKTNITIDDLVAPTMNQSRSEDMYKYFSISNPQIGYYKNVPINVPSYVTAEKMYKLIDILREIFAERGMFGIEIKVDAVLQFIYAMSNTINLDSKDTKNVDLNNFNKVRKIVEEKNIQE